MKKIISDKAFGTLAAKKFSIGDLVKWKGWYLNIKGECVQEVYHGVLTEIISERVGGREIVYGVVLPFKNNVSFQINITALKKLVENDTI